MNNLKGREQDMKDIINKRLNELDTYNKTLSKIGIVNEIIEVANILLRDYRELEFPELIKKDL